MPDIQDVQIQGFMKRFVGRRQNNDTKALNAISAALRSAGFEEQEVEDAVSVLKRRRLIRNYILWVVEDEIKEAGEVTATGQIDWDSLGDFLLKIAPIIMELLKAFL